VALSNARIVAQERRTGMDTNKNKFRRGPRRAHRPDHCRDSRRRCLLAGASRAHNATKAAFAVAAPAAEPECRCRSARRRSRPATSTSISMAWAPSTPLRTRHRAQSGCRTLLSVNLKEGDTVKQGDLLAQIDPRPFQAQLTQAQGALARDQACSRMRRRISSATRLCRRSSRFPSSKSTRKPRSCTSTKARSKPIRA